MATELIELGGARGPWMGKRLIIGRDSPKIITPFLHLYDFVDTLENPLATSGLKISELDPEEQAIVGELHRLSQRARFELVHPARLGEVPAVIQLYGLCSELGKRKSLSRRLGRFSKHLYRKVSKVVKSPAFLSIAALAVNIVPGVGQVASVALTAAAASRKVYEGKAAQKKAVKKQKAADAAAQAQYVQQITDYNKQTQAYYAGQHQQIPSGALLDANGNPTTDVSKAPGYTAVLGEPFDMAAPADTQLAQAVALSSASALNDPSQAEGANVLLDSVPPEVAQKAAQLVPAMADLAKDPNMKPATLKAVGQFVAMEELALGSGAGPLGGSEMGDLARSIREKGDSNVQKAIAAGEQDLITTAALEGADQRATTEAAIKTGQGKLSGGGGGGFPLVPVLIGVGGLAAVGTVVYLVA